MTQTEDTPAEPPLQPRAAFALTVTRRQWRPLALVLTVAVLGVSRTTLTSGVGLMRPSVSMSK